MAGKLIAGDGSPENLAGMSKNQLYDIMSQMKTLIEQNQQQARQILIQNPLLTKALFQAQIMLGMLQPPQVIPNIQPPAQQIPQKSLPTTQQSNIQATPSSAVQLHVQDQTGVSQMQTLARKQLHQNQQTMPVSSASAPVTNVQSQPMPSIPMHTPQPPKGYQIPQVNPMSVPQSSQLPSISPIPHHSSSQPSLLHQPQIPTTSSQLQQPLQTSGIPHLPLQPPLPPQPRPHSVPNFQHHHYTPQMGPNMGYQPTGAPQHGSQPMFHSGIKPPASVGLPFPQGQQAHPSQQIHQSMYQPGGSNLGAELSNQVGSSMQVDRGSSWMSGPPENPTLAQLPGMPPSVPSQMASGNQHARPPPLSPEMEKMLLQQVMSLTPEQINLLPPEQRNQVFQLQQMLRQ